MDFKRFLITRAIKILFGFSRDQQNMVLLEIEVYLKWCHVV